MFTKQAVELAKNFWSAYLKRDQSHIDGIMDMCGNKFVIIGIKEGEASTNKDGFRKQLEILFAKKRNNFNIVEEEYDLIATSRSSCVVYGSISVLSSPAGMPTDVFSGQNHFFTYGFSIAIKKEKEQVLMSYLHCWRINKAGKSVNAKTSAIGSEGVSNEWSGVNLYREAFNSTHDMVFGIDIRTGCVSCDECRLQRLFNIDFEIKSLKDVQDMAFKLIHPNDSGKVIQDLDDHVLNMHGGNMQEFVSQAVRVCYKEEGYIWCTISLIPVLEESGAITKVVSHLRDINRFKEKEQLIRHQSYFDNLTGCLNEMGARLNIEEYLSSMANNGILMMFDIDELKLINEGAGYEVGDQVLFDFSAILKRYIREDDVIARISSDNFIVYIKGSRSKDSLKRTIGEIFEEFSDYVYNRELNSKIRCFAAAAWYGTDAEDYDSLYKIASDRMDKIKTRGKRNYLI